MTPTIDLACEPKIREIPLEQIVPTHPIHGSVKHGSTYRQIAASIQQSGVIEPLVVHPKGGKPRRYLLLDGHLRYAVLQTLGVQATDCLIALDDEALTYNARVSRLLPIQQHFMIRHALENGVSEETLAKALDIDVKTIRRKKDLLLGVRPEVVELLRTRRIPQKTLDVLRGALPERQLQMAQLMVATENYATRYAECLIAATPEDQLTQKAAAKRRQAPASQELTRVAQETAATEQEFCRLAAEHGAHVLRLASFACYLRTLIERPRLRRYLEQHHAELLTELEPVVAAHEVQPKPSERRRWTRRS